MSFRSSDYTLTTHEVSDYSLTTHEVSDYTLTTHEVSDYTPTTYEVTARDDSLTAHEVRTRSEGDQREVTARSEGDQREVTARSEGDQRDVSARLYKERHRGSDTRNPIKFATLLCPETAFLFLTSRIFIASCLQLETQRSIANVFG